MKLAACLIVKDEAHRMEKCLTGLISYVDGVFVYDTGSQDGTQEICRSMGATVKQGEWRNDFAWARNRSYELPGEEYDWIVYLDADDSISGAERLRGLCGDALGSTTGFSFRYENTWGNLHVDYFTRRLTRRNCYYWKYPLHEQLVSVGEESLVENKEVVWRQEHSLEDRQVHTQRNLDFLYAYQKDHELDDWLASAIVLTLIEQGRAREAHQWMLDNRYVMDIRPA